MSKFYIIGKISHELLERMQKDPAADRSASTKKVIEAAGGKMISYEWVRGRYDVICCVEGDAGAPLTIEEAKIIEENLEDIKPEMRVEGVKAVEENGISYLDDGEQVTTLVNKKESPERHSHFKKFELSKEQHIKLANICIENKVQYSASVWDLSRFDWIDAFLKFYKVGSGDLTAYSLLESIAKIGKPIVLSTGLSDLSEITDTVNFLKLKFFIALAHAPIFSDN